MSSQEGNSTEVWFGLEYGGGRKVPGSRTARGRGGGARAHRLPARLARRATCGAQRRPRLTPRGTRRSWIAYESVEVSIGIGRALRGLGRRDQTVLLLRLCCDLSQDEIASRIGVSQMHLSRILRTANTALTAACGLGVPA